MNLFNNVVFIISGILMFLFLSVIFSLGMFEDTLIGIWAMLDPISFMVVFSAVNLYFIAFINIGKPKMGFHLYKSKWLQEVMIILGVFYAVTPLFVMFAGDWIKTTDNLASQLGGSLAVSIITVAYALLGAFSFFVLEKFIELNKNNSPKPNVHNPKEKFKFTSLVHTLIFGFIFAMAYYLVIISIRGNLTIFISNNLIFVFVIILFLTLFYKGDSFLNLIKSLFVYFTDNEKNIRYNIYYIQNMKKILGVFFSITLIIVPILLWGGMVEKTGESNVLPFISIRNTLHYSHWSGIFIILLSLMEGSQANKLYLQTGDIITFDRYFALKFLLAPIFLIYLYIGFSTLLAFVVI